MSPRTLSWRVANKIDSAFLRPSFPLSEGSLKRQTHYYGKRGCERDLSSVSSLGPSMPSYLTFPQDVLIDRISQKGEFETPPTITQGSLQSTSAFLCQIENKTISTPFNIRSLFDCRYRYCSIVNRRHDWLLSLYVCSSN